MGDMLKKLLQWFFSFLLATPLQRAEVEPMRRSQADASVSWHYAQPPSVLLPATTMSIIAADSLEPFAFPVELELHIFELAALTWPVSIPRLMLAAWRVKSL
jgi:hypothetical protein